MKATLDASRLEALLESAQLLHGTLDLRQLLRHLLRTVMGRLLISKALIAVTESGQLRVAEVRGLAPLSRGEALDEEAARKAGIERFLVIGSEEQPVGMLGIGRTIRAIDKAEEDFLQALLGIAANGISNAHAHSRAQQLNQDLNQKVQDLRALLELVQSLTSTLEPIEIAHLLALTLTGRWAVGRYALTAWKENHPPLSIKRGLQLPPPDELAEHLAGVPGPILVSELPAGSLRNLLESKKAAVLFPFRSNDTVIGAVALGERLGGLSFNAADLEFGAGLAGQAIVAFENSWHFHETLEKRKMEQEVGLAANIQKDLFPRELPSLDNIDMAARSLAARQVGGDYYDILPIGQPGTDQPHLICVADVSGKGIPASLLMSSIQATLRALLSPDLPVVELVQRTSQLLYATTPSSKYATAVLVKVDPASRRLEYVSAGHNDVLLLRADGTIDRLASTGPPIGLIPGLPFSQGSIDLQSGDLLALYSDGVVEAQNPDEQEYEEERFIEVLRASEEGNAEQVIDAVFESVMEFAGLAPQHDDITLFVLKALDTSES